MATRREIIAHHEAGHAVAAHRLGVRIKRLSIKPDNIASGRATIGKTSDETLILIILAGPYAQKRFAPHSAWRKGNTAHLTSGYDFGTVAGLIDDLHGNGTVAKLYWRYVEAKAEQLVGQWWNEIEGVARALLERETLTGNEMKRAILAAHSLEV